MYKSAYMVQIMRSKRSIKEEGKEKKMYIISKLPKKQTKKKKMQQSRRGATILQNDPKLLGNFSLGS